VAGGDGDWLCGGITGRAGREREILDVRKQLIERQKKLSAHMVTQSSNGFTLSTARLAR